MNDITLTEFIVGYTLFGLICLLLRSLYLKYRRKLKPKRRGQHVFVVIGGDIPIEEVERLVLESLNKRNTPTIPPREDAHELFSEAQKAYIQTIAGEISCTEEEIRAEEILPLYGIDRTIDSNLSVYYDEMGNLANVMRGRPVSDDEELAAYHTASKIVNTELFEQMMDKIEDAKQNLTTLFSKITTAYDAPTSADSYPVYECMDYLPVKRKEHQVTAIKKPF